MRIRRSAASSVSPSPSPSSCSSSSSCFSSSSTHSTISAHSLFSSSSSSFSLLPAHRSPRCEGLDLLVKAVYHVAGSVVGVPYIQRRVIRRRKPAIRFNNFLIGSEKEERGFHNDEQGEVFDGSSDEQKKLMRRSRTLSTEFRGPVLPSSKSENRRRRRSKV